jgi:hypothetical protein
VFPSRDRQGVVSSILQLMGDHMKLLPFLFVLAALLFATFFLAAGPPGPFWQEKPPAEWTDAELVSLLTNSPWAQMVPPPSGADAPTVEIYLATAGPMDKAEHERDRRYKIKRPQSDPVPGAALLEEYRAWLEDNRATQIVVAIAIHDGKAFADEQETRRMEQESVMRVGKKKFKITGHFPPTTADPYLRLAFPRAATEADKTVSFDLYVPGVAIGFRSAEFRIKDMLVNGKLEM